MGPDGHTVSENNLASCSILSYTVDSSPPVNITAEISVRDIDGTIFPQLILQTPPFLRQQHTLTLTCLEPWNETEAPILSAIVQNTTRSIDLAPFPSILSSALSIQGMSSTSSTLPSSPRTSAPFTAALPNAHHINNGIITAIAVSTFVILLIVVWFWRRFVQNRTTLKHDRQSMAEPFSAPDPVQIGQYRLAQYTTTEDKQISTSVWHLSS